MGWYCVVSKPNQENRAAVELAKQGFEVFLPILDAKPMFPRYLFTAFDVERDNWGVIRSTRGCIDLLKHGFIPSEVPDRVMTAIRAYRPLQEPQDGHKDFQPGQAVKITNGPLQGLEGLFVADHRKRCYALLDILGRQVQIARDSIEAA